MTEHPVATAEQHAHELAALELVEHPTVRAAYRTVAETWLVARQGLRRDARTGSRRRMQR